MHRPQFFTWTTYTAENTTLLDYKKLYTYMCNIVTELVTEFYLYSIVYIYLINSRLDVTHSVRHHFRAATLSWCQRVVRISRNRENLTAIELHNNNNDNKSDTLSWCQTSGKSREEFTVIKLTHTYTAFQEAF